MRTYKIVLLSVISILVMISCESHELTEVVFLEHKLEFKLNIEKQSAAFTDTGLMQVKKGANMFYLAPNAKISYFELNDVKTEFTVLDTNNLQSSYNGFADEIRSLEPPESALWVLFDQKTPKKVSFKINYSTVFNIDVSEAKFSNQNIGREITGTILEKGAYFSPRSFYYPQGDDELMHFSVTATIPPDWESIADGNSVASVSTQTSKIQSWENPFESEGLMFVAAPFKVAQMKTGDVDVYCYFFEADTNLFEAYLPATAGYVDMYSKLIGPYPFKRFTVAENFFPTGYGMPAWTLLGQQVIRLPFIVLSSLGHEVLHNWWGNSIYVDYKNGNWCEGLTVYGADYHYKLQRSEASARDYRKDILKAYKNYVTPENEFPVREFVERHNAESRTIGYNKAMMIFHMIEDRVGTENFFQTWRNIYAAHKGEQVTWEAWLSAYEKSSGQDLSFIIPQWVDRTGAARIAVDLLEKEKSNGQTRIKFKVTQPDQVYNLKIPVHFIGVENQNHWIELSDTEKVFQLTVSGNADAFELDPDYDLFRHLYPEEIEPTIAAALGTKEKHFLYKKAEDKATLKVFGDELIEKDITPEAESANQNPEGGYAVITLNPEKLPADLARQVSLTETRITIMGKEYLRTGNTFVLSADNQERDIKMLIVISADPSSLPRLGQLIPHYGKYSYLVFHGSHNIAKGQWPAQSSPLRVEL